MHIISIQNLGGGGQFQQFFCIGVTFLKMKLPKIICNWCACHFLLIFACLHSMYMLSCQIFGDVNMHVYSTFYTYSFFINLYSTFASTLIFSTEITRKGNCIRKNVFS